MLKSKRGVPVLHFRSQEELEFLSGKKTGETEVGKWVQEYTVAKRYAKILWRHILYKDIGVRCAQNRLNFMMNYSTPFHRHIIKPLLVRLRKEIEKNKKRKAAMAVRAVLKFNNHLRFVYFGR